MDFNNTQDDTSDGAWAHRDEDVAARVAPTGNDGRTTPGHGRQHALIRQMGMVARPLHTFDGWGFG